MALEDLQLASWIAQLDLTEEEHEEILNEVNRRILQLARRRETNLEVLFS